MDDSKNLLHAIRARDREAVRLLLKNTTSVYFDDALRIAAEAGDTQIVTLLLDKGAHLDSAPGNGGTALRAAVAAGNLDVVQLLLEKGADPDCGGFGSSSLLTVAARAGNLEIMKLLIGKGANFNGSPSHTVFPLRAAAEAGHRDIVQLLLDDGANIDAPALRSGFPLTETPLTVAARVGDKAMVELLLNRGAYVNGNLGSALDAAVRSGHKEVAALLRSRSADEGIARPANPFAPAYSGANKTMSMRPMHEPSGIGLSQDSSPRPWDRQSLLKHHRHPEGSSDTYRHSGRNHDSEHAHVHKKTPGGFERLPSIKDLDAALKEAVEMGDLEETRTLLQRGASPNGPRASLVDAPATASPYSDPPLVTAARNGDASIVNLLLKYYPDVNLSHPVHGPPLLAAALTGDKGIVQSLISHGAKLPKALRWLDGTASKQGFSLLRDYPSFEDLYSSQPPPPLSPWHLTQALDNAVMMAAQLGIVDAKIDSIEWEWELPSVIGPQSSDLSLKNAVIVMRNPLRDSQKRLSDHFLAITWDEWLADCTSAHERDNIKGFLTSLMTAASNIKGGISGWSTLL